MTLLSRDFKSDIDDLGRAPEHDLSTGLRVSVHEDAQMAQAGPPSEGHLAQGDRTENDSAVRGGAGGLAGADPVEVALGEALLRASREGRHDLVPLLVDELRARRQERAAARASARGGIE